MKITDMLQGSVATTEETLSEIGLQSCSAKLLPAGTVLISVFATIGRTAVLAIPAATNQAIAGVVPLDPSSIDSSFLRYFLDSKRPQLIREARGVAQPNINQSILRDLELPLLPIAEQRRIVDLLSRAEGVVRLRRQAQQKAAELIPAIFMDMFGDPATNPKGWTVARLGDVAHIQGGLQVTSARAALPLERPYLRVANVHRSRLDLTEIKTIRLTQAELDRTQLEAGDLLFVEGHGNPQEVGRVAIWDNSIPSCTHQNHLIRARARADVLLPAFACALLNSANGRQSLLKAGKTTSGLSTISAQNVKDAKMLLPPLSAQENFRRQVEAVEGIGALHEAAAKKAEEAFRSLLARAFTGTGQQLHPAMERALA